MGLHLQPNIVGYFCPSHVSFLDTTGVILIQDGLADDGYCADTGSVNHQFDKTPSLRGKHLHSSSGENNRHPNFFSPREMHPPKYRHWQQDQNEIADDIIPTKNGDEFDPVQTFGTVGMGPIILQTPSSNNWPTSKNTDDGGYEGPQEDDGSQDEADPSES